LTIVIPAFNEAESLIVILPSLLESVGSTIGN
jgi:hypothetical protein